MVKKRPLHLTSFDEAERYFRNARGLLSRCRVQDDFYVDIKPVREAFGTAWLAVDIAVKAALKEKGVAKIPRSWDALLAAVGRDLAAGNGRLVSLLTNVHHLVHVAGYYYGDLTEAAVARDALDAARRVIEKLSRRRIA